MGYGLGQLFLSLIADCFKRKHILLISALLFVVISFFAAFSPNIYILIFYRCLQGIFMAGISINIRAMIPECFTGIDINKGVIYGSTSFALGPIIGPFIGGYLQHYIGWKANFFFFGIYGLMVAAYIAWILPEIKKPLHPFHLIKLSKTVLKILSHKIFLLSSIFLSLIYAILIIFDVIGPFIIQVVLKYSAVTYGHIALILGLGYFLGNLFNRFLIRYFQPMKIVIFSLFCSLLISVVLLILNIAIKLNLYIVIIPVFFIFFCSGILLSTMMAKILSLFAQNAGMATAIYGTILSAGVFVISMIASIFKTNTLIPMSIGYVAIALICLILFVSSKAIEKNIEK